MFLYSDLGLECINGAVIAIGGIAAVVAVDATNNLGIRKGCNLASYTVGHS